MFSHIDAGPVKGPYSAAIRAGDLLYLSGQGGFDPATGAVVAGGIEAQTRQTLVNIRDLLAQAGLGLDRLVQVTCYLTDIDDWPHMNALYAEALGDDARPTRTAVGVAALPLGLVVEMTAVAYAG